MVAKSLPISTGYQNGHQQTLSNFGQSDRSRHSRQQQWQVNNDGFGRNSASMHQTHDLNSSHKNSKVPSSKYYYSLEEELEIDPDIAADMARYLR